MQAVKENIARVKVGGIHNVGGNEKAGGIKAVVTRGLGGAMILAVLGACAGGPRLHELQPRPLFERGMSEYEEGNYAAAIRAFEMLATRYPTHPDIADARYYTAAAYYENEDYLTAATEFNRFASDFGSSPLADDARFRVCESYYMLSPEIQLDQMYTHAAIDHCSSLLAYFPDSEYTTQARDIISELREKLARKVYVVGDYYYTHQAYDSAIIYFEDVADNHPDTEAAAQSLLRLVQIYKRLGYTEDARSARERLLNEYPDSSHAERARNIILAGGM